MNRAAPAHRTAARTGTGTGRAPALLGIYLNDHLMGSGAGVRLIRRIRDRHSGTPIAPDLDTLVRELDEDQESLRRVINDLDVPVSRVREAVGRLAEAAGRLKLNGRLVSRSPLSDVLEFEGMLLGVEGKAACWRALRAVADVDPRIAAADMDRLLARADAQSRTLEELRHRRAAEVFAADLRGQTSPAPGRHRPHHHRRPGSAPRSA
ncbi:hypothetical protein [Streptomyces sp. RerS4]|uniref:hypothetical protein n=1 Tax=Streptomyces sp. RerS4 TaxID=2942449 RepID=UPI00201CA4BB|nr:hypothetical protein [Streptomyces sp. RerS4]UQX04248.1 hypothetical protein M4D82_29900 [Streptomyces sp. RerS4]